MIRHWILSGLICLNLILGTALIIAAAPLPTARAQATGLAGNYMMVAGEVRDEFDGLYVIDMRSRIMHAFYYDIGTKQLRYADSRDLERDFRNN